MRQRRLNVWLVLYLLVTTVFVAGIPRPVAAAGEQVRGELNGWGATTWAMSTSLGGSFIHITGQVTDVDDPESEFKFFKNTNQWFSNAATVAFGQILTGMNTGTNPNMRFNHTQNRFYAFKWDGDTRGVVFQLSAAPVNITAVNRSPGSPGASDAVLVTATTNAPPPAEQALWLRYALNGNWGASTVVKMSGSGTSYTATIPAQPASTQVSYYVFSSGNVASIAGADADLMTITFNTNSGNNYTYTVSSGAPTSITTAKALWLDPNTIAWNGASGASYRLLYDPDGEMNVATAGNMACTFPAPSAPCFVALTSSGTVSGFAKNPNATGLPRLLTGLSDANAKHLLKGQLAVASYNASNTLIEASGVQLQSVLDQLYATNAASVNLGVSYSGTIPTLRVWAPTAQNVVVYRYANPTDAALATNALTEDPATGVWSITGDASWDRQYYMLGVTVFVPGNVPGGTNKVELNVVSDPYAITLSADTIANSADPRSQFVNLNDADLKPAGWDTLAKPPLNNFEDITIYEMHIRDFSINDATVTDPNHRGTYMAFTYDGTGPDPNSTLSNGMAHLLALRQAGLTHVHLLPTFDIASVPENSVPRSVSPNPTGFGRAAQDQQAAVGTTRATDGFNWGYDPHHFGAVDGSYSTNANDGTVRVLEFRRMVSALNQNGLRVVMDVVYNHTAASGLTDKSVLDKVVPGYYHRYTTNGALYTSSCCDDTASEYAMFEKLMIDTLKRFAVDYKIDGFRFDLMNLHTRQNMLNVKAAMNAIDPKIYLYGEGWTFGSALEKGLTSCPNCFADKYNMTGAGIGLFNDIIRDAAHGGYSQDSLGIRQQGFINGLSYDWNGFFYSNRFQNHLHDSMNRLRSGLRASGTDWSGAGAPFAADPQESMPYIEKHDNETLFDQNVFKMPSSVTMAERVRAQNMGMSLIALSQGVPFFHMGSDILRSKSLDRNSYDSGDWFNRVFWDRSSNNFGQGLPPAWDNSSRWGIMTSLLNNPALDPTTADMNASAAHFRELLRIRQSSPLFRLTTMEQVNNQVTFFNGNNAVDALIVMGLLDNGPTDLDSNYETILVFFNADKVQKTFTVTGANGFSLHPVHTNGVDDDPVITSGASFNDATDTFTIPARTTVVFVSTQPLANPTPPSTLDWVGTMFPRGGVAHQINQGNFAPAGFDVFVQVYEAGWTEPAGANPNIACYLHWGQYGQPFTDLPMTWNAQIGNNDEYKATIPQATLNALAPGSYGFTAYCQKTGETGKKWKADGYNITAANDDDQGDGLITVIPTTTSYPAPAGATFVHLFEWPWADVAKECTFLAQKGYRAVQVSPPNEHIVPTANQGGISGAEFPWWARYQPVSHDVTKFTSRSGTLAEFQNMITACNTAGVDIYVDAVINHMADIQVGTPPTGTSGTQYQSTLPGRFYGSQYDQADFHSECTIVSYRDRNQVQRCKLAGLPDLNTGSPTVQSKLNAYLQALLNMGVKGFRIDASKHMAAHELGAILNGLSLPGGGKPFIYHEVIDVDPTERVRDWEYIPHGAVQEFQYSIVAMGEKFNNCNSGAISQLENIAGYDKMMASQFAVVFTDNHDNQRGHGPGGACVVDHRDGRVHQLANIFMLAYPYGYPMITSSYYWTTNPNSDAGDSLGPPSSNDGGTTWGVGLGAATRPVYGPGQNAGDVPANCSPNYPADVLNAANLGTWVCEHRNNGIANMVEFRQVTLGQPLTNWQNIGTAPTNHIAFGRNGTGFVAINNTGANATTTYNTGMPPGVYCDVISGQRNGAACTGTTVTVNDSGQIVNFTLNSRSALAIHLNSRIQTRFYVDASRPDDSGDGSSWATAKRTLQAALALANPVDPATVEIWVADGTYYPDEGTGQTNNARTSTFTLKNRVAIYGGFAGNETQLSQRDPVANVAILSGDLQQNDTANFGNNADNAYHVVTSNGNATTAILDGFTITSGNANGSSDPDNRGGGIYVLNGSQARFANLAISGNVATIAGGGVYNTNSSPSFIRSFMSGNTSDHGGGVFTNLGSPSFTDVTISGNTAMFLGGGIYLNDSGIANFTNVIISGNRADLGGGVLNDGHNPVFTNVTISGNHANTNGGGLYTTGGNPTFTNSIIWGNNTQVFIQGGAPTYAYSLVQGATLAGTGNLAGTANPLFVNPIAATSAPTTAGNYRLQVNSPAIDAADPASGPATDRDGLPRPNDGNADGIARRDLGAYEAGQMICGVVAGQTYTFTSNGGARLQVTNLGTMTPLACLYVDQTNVDHPNATPGIRTGSYWTIHGLQSNKLDDASGFSVNLTLPAPFTPTANDKLCRYTGTGTIWDCAMSSLDTVNKTITRNGVTQFSDWAIGDEVTPTAITLLEFTATRETNGVRLNWATGSELNTAGFRLERGLTNDPATATPLEAAGFIPGEGDLVGAAYSYLDTEAAPGQTYYYWLIEVERDGRETRYGPARVTEPSLDSLHRVFMPLIRR